MSHIEPILQKIRKLLALAGNNSNEHERLSAMRKAQELLRDHNLTLADVSTNAPEEITAFLTKLKSEKWCCLVCINVCRLYYCDAILFEDASIGTKMMIVGAPSNAKVAVEICNWIIRSVEAESERYYKTEDAQSAFKTGASIRISERCRTMIRRERLAGMMSSTDAGEAEKNAELRRLADQKIKEFFDDKNVYDQEEDPRRDKTPIDYGAFIDGVQFGNKVGLNRQLEAKQEEPAKRIAKKRAPEPIRYRIWCPRCKQSLGVRHRLTEKLLLSVCIDCKAKGAFVRPDIFEGERLIRQGKVIAE